VTVRLWRLGLLALAVLLTAAFLLGRWTTVSHASGISPQEQVYDFAQGQARGLVIARAYRASQRLTARATAISHVRWAIPDVELYNADNVPGSLHNDPDAVSVGPVGRDLGMDDSGYTGMTVALLTDIYDRGFPHATWVNPRDLGYPAGLARVTPTAAHYCVIAHSGDWYAWKLGPSGSILVSRSPATVCQRPGFGK
jgi:hypothetical protein